MGAVNIQPSTVVGPNGERYPISPGDAYPAPYRGLRLTMHHASEGGHILCHRRKFGKGHLFKLNNTQNLTSAIHKVKKNTGSTRITAAGHVITRVKEGDLWVPRFVGVLAGSLDCRGFNLNPTDLDQGRYWPGFCFEGGETWSVGRNLSRNRVFFKYRGVLIQSVHEHPELCHAIRNIRPRGGRIYLVPGGHIWMNLPLREASYYGNSVLRKQKPIDREVYSEGGLDLSLQHIQERINVTGCHPIYVGHVSDFDGGRFPSAMFSMETMFSKGTNREDVDDEDRY